MARMTSNGNVDHIREGMLVVDASNTPVGVVTASHLHVNGERVNGEGINGQLPPRASHAIAHHNAPTMSNGDVGTSGAPFIPTISGSFLGSEKMPELLYVRLQRTGFLRVERAGGRVTRTYYVTPDQIGGVAGDYIRLSVLREMLLGA